ncbi:MAG: tol-pal system protein YbgF [Proteobacteria bacterium]|nr:tol-pal system protein YbgF [Pseudomonadota bacterium]
MKASFPRSFVPAVRGAVLAALMCAVTVPAFAQSARDLAPRIDKIEQSLAQMQAQAPNEGNLQVRVLKLEALIEQLTGQVEEANFRIGQLQKQLKTMEDDLQLRVARLEAGGASAADAVAIPGGAAAAPPAALPPRADAGPSALVPSTPSAAAPPRRRASGDEPLSEPMTPPRVTRPASAPPPGTPAASGMGNDGSFVIRTDANGKPLPPDPADMAPVAEAPAEPAPAPVAPPKVGAVNSGQLAMAPPVGEVKLPEGTPKVQYDFAFDLLRRNDFARAEVAFRDFLKRHPKDPLAGNAQYWLGETHYVRGDYQQAAVEFMAGYQNYPKTNKGPDNLLKLAMSMSNLGQTQGACTALGRLAKDYPKAPEEVAKPAAAERAKLKCK